MRIAFDELVPDGEEVVRVRLCWSRQEADLVGAVLGSHGLDFAEEEALEGWSVYTSQSDAPRALTTLAEAGVDRSENVYNAGL
jgi:hypothetical protein